MPKFRRRPTEVEAMQFQDTKEGIVALMRFIPSPSFIPGRVNQIQIKTPKGWITAWPGDWIILSAEGEFSICLPDIFAKTYEEVKE